ncbi:MAG: iron ABC transporter permease [Longimonas sp.]|uniref:FecCD family ABC transporter permease n=1 Tax=Longimonas sp. TaxID=2039626 RepID=UPI0033534E7A
MRTALLSLGLLGALLVTVGAALSFGSAAVSFADAYHVVAYRVADGFGASSPLDVPDPIAERVVWHLRLPRVLLALLVGGGLSVIGVAMQALVRNPLAEPYILGISSGASAGASLFYLGFLPPLLGQALSMPLAAFLGGLLSITIVYLVAYTGSRLSVARLLLAGVAMSALMASVTSFITFSSPDPGKLRAVLFWLLGSLSGTQWTDLVWPFVTTASGSVLLFVLARPLDAMLIGEESAYHLGIPVEALKRLLIGLAALVTGALVAVAGAIGFVGLIIPHAVRLLIGVSHRRVVPVAFIGGALFLAWADLAARTLLPEQELPVGILTALCGVPFFLALLRRGSYGFGAP